MQAAASPKTPSPVLSTPLTQPRPAATGRELLDMMTLLSKWANVQTKSTAIQGPGASLVRARLVSIAGQISALQADITRIDQGMCPES